MKGVWIALIGGGSVGVICASIGIDFVSTILLGAMTGYCVSYLTEGP